MADMEKRIARFIEPFRVNPGSSVKLSKDFDPAFKAGVEKKADGEELLNDGIELLSDYQARLAAQDTHGVLVVLQALDAAGKDGTIRHVMSGVNPQGVRVESFKVPSARELDQDFLRRYQERLPSRGEIAHLQPVPLRGGAGRPGASREPRAPEAPGRRRGAPRLETQVRSDQRLGAVSLPQRVSDREDLPQPLEGGTARPLPAAHRPPRAPLEVLVPRCGGAPVLGRLPGRVLGDVESHQHRVGALVRDPGRPQVVCAHRGRRGDRSGADRHRPAVPDARRRRTARPPGGKDAARIGGTRRSGSRSVRRRKRRAHRSGHSPGRRAERWPPSSWPPSITAPRAHAAFSSMRSARRSRPHNAGRPCTTRGPVGSSSTWKRSGTEPRSASTRRSARPAPRPRTSPRSGSPTSASRWSFGIGGRDARSRVRSPGRTPGRPPPPTRSPPTEASTASRIAPACRSRRTPPP